MLTYQQVVTLLQLTQGSASTENALKASEQSKILAIFTVVTVIFVSAYILSGVAGTNSPRSRPHCHGLPHSLLSRLKASMLRRHGRQGRSPAARVSSQAT